MYGYIKCPTHDTKYLLLCTFFDNKFSCIYMLHLTVISQ